MSTDDDREFLRKMGLTAWQVDFTEGYEDTDRIEMPFDLGNAVGSSRTPGKDGDAARHAVFLDIDNGVALRIIPSSTEGHFHIVMDTRARWSEFCLLLELLANMGVIERGYANMMIERGQAFLRMPGQKKGHETYQKGPVLEDEPFADNEEPF